MTAIVLLLAAACSGDSDSGAVPTTDDPVGDTDDTDDTDVSGETAHTGATDTGPVVPTGDTAPELDCSVLPPVPVTYTVLNQFSTSEDFDFDGGGYLCSITGGFQGTLACADRYGSNRIIAPNLLSSSAGTRVLVTGDWVVADVGAGALRLVDGITGGSVPIATGLQYPNGVEVDADNQVYVAEQSGSRVRQIDAYTGDQSVIATGLSNPNGVILSPDGNTLYVGSFGGGVVYAIDRLGPDTWDPPRIFFDPAGWDGGFDGINVDICGNVYITEYTTGRIYRMTPDGSQATVIVDLPSGWIPNMRWGNNIGGWQSDILYVTAWSQIFALDMGIEGKPHLLAP